MNGNILVGIFIVFGLISCETSKRRVFCDAETISGGYIICGNDRLSGGKNTTTDEAFSGNQSVRLIKDSPYGFGYKIDQFEPGEKYKVSVYLKGTGILSVKGGEISINKKVESKNDVWEQHIISFRVPIYNTSPITVFCWNPNEKAAYFDDFELVTILSDSKKEEGINLLIHPVVLDSLRKNRSKAVRAGLITSDLKQYQKAYLNHNAVQIRLKGDWTDHVASDKFSLRIKSSTPVFEQMSRFSIQSPEMRFFLHEWVYHKMLEGEGILTTNYDFCNVTINEISMGVYAIEEHFTKSLLERYGVNQGAIIKYDETPFFDKVHFGKNQSLAIEDCSLKFYEPFGKLDSIQARRVKRLVNGYTSNSLPLDSIFDTDKLAKFFAIVDLNKTYHSIRWHNMRWYFNPQTNLLEPLGYDGIGSGGVSDRNNVGLILELPKSNNLGEDKYIHKHLENENFRKIYLQYCEEFAAYDYIVNFIATHKNELENLEVLIQQDFPEYSYDYSFLEQSAKQMKRSIQLVKQSN
jgi:hypothetical protein